MDQGRPRVPAKVRLCWQRKESNTAGRGLASPLLWTTNRHDTPVRLLWSPSKVRQQYLDNRDLQINQHLVWHPIFVISVEVLYSAARGSSSMKQQSKQTHSPHPSFLTVAMKLYFPTLRQIRGKTTQEEDESFIQALKTIGVAEEKIPRIQAIINSSLK